MKKTVKTSRVAGQLEKMYRLLNARFFNGELPEVVISLKKTVGAYGHFTCSKVWQAGDERRYEINISSATLSRPIEETCATLLHEMCHCLAAEKGIKDTSGSGNFYHNRKYKEIAESHGLCVEKHPKYGWTITSPGLPLLDFIEEQGWQDLQMCEAVSLWDVIGTLPKGAGNGTATKTKKPSSTRKYICPCCHQSVRATKAVNILCGDCMEKMEPAEYVTIKQRQQPSESRPFYNALFKVKGFQMNWKYDYYNCPDDPDTGVPACGDLPECRSCEWYNLITSAQKCTTT